MTMQKKMKINFVQPVAKAPKKKRTSNEDKLHAQHFTAAEKHVGI